MKIIADTHTHTVACDHAYSTLTENMAAAGERGLKFVALTEHAPSIPGAPSTIFFHNLRSLPRKFGDVVLLRGAEVNILDYKGTLDLSDGMLGRMEWVIASLHVPVLAPASEKDHTDCWIAVAHNPLVDVIGHCGDGRYRFDHKAAVREWADTGKIVEINANSFSVREGSAQNCRAVALLCAEYGVPIVLNSDAHYHGAIGWFSPALEMLQEISFPEELVLNADYDRFLAVAREKSGKPLTDLD